MISWAPLPSPLLWLQSSRRFLWPCSAHLLLCANSSSRCLSQLGTLIPSDKAAEGSEGKAGVSSTLREQGCCDPAARARLGTRSWLGGGGTAALPRGWLWGSGALRGWGRGWQRRCRGELRAMSGLLSLCSSVPSGGTGSDGNRARLLICSYPRSEMQGMSGTAPLEQGLSARIHIPPS